MRIMITLTFANLGEKKNFAMLNLFAIPKINVAKMDVTIVSISQNVWPYGRPNFWSHDKNI